MRCALDVSCSIPVARRTWKEGERIRLDIGLESYGGVKRRRSVKC